jgi:hypothetical protein
VGITSYWDGTNTPQYVVGGQTRDWGDTILDDINQSIDDEVGAGRPARFCRHVREDFHVDTKSDIEIGVPAVYAYGTHDGYSVYSGYTERRAYLSSQYMQALRWRDRMHRYNATLPPGLDSLVPPTSDSIVVKLLYQRAWNNVVDGGLNIAEAHDIQRTIESFAQKEGEFHGAYSAYTNKLKTLKRLGKSLTPTARKYLAYQFGVAPLLRDIYSAWAYWPKVKADFERYHRRAVSRVTSTRRGVFALSKREDPTTQGYQAYFSWDLDPVYRWVLVYQEKNPYHTKTFEYLSYLSKRFGGYGGFSLAWEVIPFSFVLDWFGTIGLTLNNIDIAINDSIKTLSLTRSLKYKTKVDVYRRQWRSDTDELVQNEKRGTIGYSVYERRPLHQSFLPDWNFRFGKKQALISGALLLTLKGWAKLPQL